jgi:hypothetical protein
MSLRIASLICMALFAGYANSSSNPQADTLPWPRKGEQLTYRSCGCADSCWLAELRDRKSRRLVASLRCDCSSLLVTYPAKSPERELTNSCSDLNERADKRAAIAEKMKNVVIKGEK